MAHETQPEPSGHVGIGRADPRLEVRARVDDGDPQVVIVRGQLRQDRSVGANLSVNHAVGDELADDQRQLRRSSLRELAAELRSTDLRARSGALLPP